MHSPSKTRLIRIGAVLTLLVILGLVADLTARRKQARPFFAPAPSNVTLQFLGRATNYLKLDHDHNWKAFSVSNGTSKLLFYTVTAIDYRNGAGWLSHSPAAASLMSHRETPGEILPGSADVIYASIPASSSPWRLRVGCFEASWHDPLEISVSKFRSKLQGLPPSNQNQWTGKRYELISSEIAP